MAHLDATLRQLAEAYDIAVDYWDWQGVHTDVPADTIVKVLTALGVDASTPAAAEQALAEHRRKPWSQILPPCLALRENRTEMIPVHVPEGTTVSAQIELETGGAARPCRLTPSDHTETVDGQPVIEVLCEIPADLPLGYHTLMAETDTGQGAMTLIITPEWLGLPASMGDRRGWGLATQLYSVRSGQSWGVGDLVDCADLAVWSAAEHGADFILVNPLHAAEPLPPMEPSPYLPTSRRFGNPIYLRVERVPEYAVAPEGQRREIVSLLADLRSNPEVTERIERDACWTAKRAALMLVFAVPRSAGRECSLAAYRHREGDGLSDYATFAALSEVHGPDSSRWPEGLRHPANPEVATFRAEHEREITFHVWLQWLLDGQLAEAQQAGLSAGMSLGIMHDLAVGVHPTGADAWSRQDDYATQIAVGAPPDPYNQHGQSWSQPPWRPDRLSATAYAPYRAMVSTVLRHAGGIRVDHVIGLFRLWWIPEGAGPKNGTYVRYDHEAMIGILALEARRAGSLVVGEDLGTVEPWVRDYLKERGILGTSILWFEGDWDGHGGPLEAERWREYCLASVTTHDLPPSAAYLVGDHVRLREELGVLTRPLEEELEVDQKDRAAWMAVLRERGLLPDGADVEETIKALHRYLGQTPSRLLCVALTDAVGDRRTQNQPGTTDEYPNWRVPLSDPDGKPMLLEEVLVSERAADLLGEVGASVGRR